MRPTEAPPAYCSGCFLSKPDQQHIDFEVAWDGPVLQENDVAGQVVSTAIDDLVLCRDCVCAAAAHVGMTDPGKDTAELEQLRDSNRVLSEKVRGLEDYASRMEAAVSAKPQTPTVKRQKAGVK